MPLSGRQPLREWGGMLLWFYRLVFLPTLAVMAPGVLWRMRKRGGYRRDFAQRFGRLPALPAKRPGVVRIWLQAVSVGEVLAIEPLVKALLKEPGVELYLTTSTSTGLAVARQRYGPAVLGPGYFPLDWAPFVGRTWRTVQPDLMILTEGERWPEHVAAGARRHVPVVCVNARLSDRSFRRMQAARPLVRGLLGGISQLLAVSEEDAARFRALGFSPERVVVTGNLKLDVELPEIDAAQRERLRRELGLAGDDLILLGSSTWPGEEAALLAAWQAARAAGIRCRLLIVPRHEERRGEIELLLRSAQINFHLRSRGPAPEPVDVAVADTTGELRQLTPLADVVFVGKSLPPHHEGQTPVEAAALGRPLLFGPRMSNFRAIARDLVEVGAAETVADAAALATAVTRLLKNPELRSRMAQSGRAWQQASRGSLERTLGHLRRHIPRH